MKKLIGVLLVTCFNFAGAYESISPAYININTGIAQLYNLPTGSWASGVNAGYNIESGFAVEGGYTFLPSSQFGTTVTQNVFDVAVKGTMTVGNVFSYYGRLGLGVGLNNWSGTPPVGNCILTQSGQSSTYLLGLAAIGASFKVSQHFDLVVEYNTLIPFQNTYTGMVTALTGGVQYNF